MEPATGRKIKVTRDGPYRVDGAIPLAKQTIVADADGGSRQWEQGDAIDAPGSYNLCRCGQSSNKPFCDNTHKLIRFDGTEVAPRDPYVEQARVFQGPELDLSDASSFCVGARFCDPDGTVWGLVGRASGPEAREKLEGMVGKCPSGRLVLWDKATGGPYEPELGPSIGLVEDPVAGVSGPLWARGGVTIESADGEAYEVRNRVTLCRCGASANKPFCDGSHAEVGFHDGL